MALDRFLGLFMALIFVVYGYTAFFEMDGLLPPILERNPVWPSSFPKILSVFGLVASFVVILNLEGSSGSRVGGEIDISEWRRYRVLDVFVLVIGMVIYALVLRFAGFIVSTFMFLFLGSVLLGERRFIMLFIVALGSSYGIWYLVDSVLGIYMAPYPSFLSFG